MSIVPLWHRDIEASGAEDVYIDIRAKQKPERTNEAERVIFFA